jgi:two-component system sensor histidine kinase MprB
VTVFTPERVDAAGLAHPTRRLSLGARVTWLAALCVAVAVGLVSVAVYITVSRALYDQVDTSLKQRADNVIGTVALFRTADNPVVEQLAASFGVKIGIVDGDGSSTPLFGPVNKPPIGPAEVKVAAEGGDNFRTDSSTDERVYAVQIQAGTGYALVLAQPLSYTQATLGRLAIVLAVVGAAGIVVAAAGGALVARGTLGPVQRLTDATERVAATGDLRPIPVSGDDELARLTQSFNTMLDALADSQNQQRQLVADAGHELRTPLTSLRTNLELLIAARKPGAPELSEQDTGELYADVRGQLDELTTLIGDLVELARQDAPHVTHESVDLVDVTERALDRARRRATSVRFDVALQPWFVPGDSSALERAVLNLLDNAVKFSPPGGTVRLSLRPLGDGTAVIEVADQGPGIAEADLPHVFQRFYRSSEARTLPGSGLGLSIVAQAAQRHGGSAQAANAPGGGALLSLRLPGDQLHTD